MLLTKHIATQSVMLLKKKRISKQSPVDKTTFDADG